MAQPIGPWLRSIAATWPCDWARPGTFPGAERQHAAVYAAGKQLRGLPTLQRLCVELSGGGLEHQHKGRTVHPGAASLAVWSTDGTLLLQGGLSVQTGREHAGGSPRHAAEPQVHSAVKEPTAGPSEKLRLPY